MIAGAANVVGVLLAGGAGSRLLGGGGVRASSKAAAELAGRPLAAYPLAALAAVCDRVAVVCKRDTELPPLAGAERWDEPDEPRHPLVGIVHALERAGAPVLVCAADMPSVTPDALRSLLTSASAATAGARVAPSAIVATTDGVLQPTLGLYLPWALATLLAAPPDEPLTRAVEALAPVRVALPARVTRSVNTPEDLYAAEALLRLEANRSGGY